MNAGGPSVVPTDPPVGRDSVEPSNPITTAAIGSILLDIATRQKLETIRRLDRVSPHRS
jgi:hypothetical protein